MKKILISAGGTGGHIFPALTVAEKLKQLGADVAWVGTPYGLENSIIPQHQIPLFLVDMKGLHNKSWKRWMMAPFMLAKALVQAIRIILRYKPDVVFGMGAYATAPVGIAAWLCRKKLVIFEQNATLGLANQLLAPLAQKVFTGFPMNGNPKFEYVSNPVRKEISDIPPPEKRQRSGSDAFHLLIFGGSQGSRILNEKIPQALAQLRPEKRPEVWHQIGKNTDQDAVIQNYKKLGITAKVDVFIDDMAGAYQWADLVICRSGASTIAELCAVGIPSVLIPLPAVGDHQTHNARFLSDAHAAILFNESSLECFRNQVFSSNARSASASSGVPHISSQSNVQITLPQAKRYVRDEQRSAQRDKAVEDKGAGFERSLLTTDSLSPILLSLIDHPALRLEMAKAARNLRRENTIDQILKALL